MQDNAVAQVESSAHADLSSTEVLQSLEPEPRVVLKKKEKQAIKHEMFLKRLESSRSPYSKSHERRLKRKAKEQVAGGMSDMQAAISAVDDDALARDAQSSEDPSHGHETRPKPKAKPGQIGEGKGAPLSKSQRKRALQLERMRIPPILSNPEFASNPFQTIRTHAQNTLLKHEPAQ